MKTLIMLSGIPASGKSTWADNYVATHKEAKIISSDAVRVELTGNYQDHSRQKEVWEEFSARIHRYGAEENATVILDALNDVNVIREKYIKESPEFDKYILVIFPFNPERSMRLNDERVWPNKVPEEILKILINKYEEPSEEVKKLFDEVVEVNWE